MVMSYGPIDRTPGIFPGWTRFFPKEKTGEFKGKFWLAHMN